MALCSTPLGSTSGKSVKEWSFDNPFLTATVIALLSLRLVLLIKDCEEMSRKPLLSTQQVAHGRKLRD